MHPRYKSFNSVVNFQNCGLTFSFVKVPNCLLMSPGPYFCSFVVDLPRYDVSDVVDHDASAPAILDYNERQVNLYV